MIKIQVAYREGNCYCSGGGYVTELHIDGVIYVTYARDKQHAMQLAYNAATGLGLPVGIVEDDPR